MLVGLLWNIIGRIITVLNWSFKVIISNLTTAIWLVGHQQYTYLSVTDSSMLSSEIEEYDCIYIIKRSKHVKLSIRSYVKNGVHLLSNKSQWERNKDWRLWQKQTHSRTPSSQSSTPASQAAKHSSSTSNLRTIGEDTQIPHKWTAKWPASHKDAVSNDICGRDKGIWHLSHE